jgi:prepilin-type N-terminal cleavage/methylation domain-containing protein
VEALKGFSLIELVVVITIIAIMVAVVVPQLSRRETSAVRIFTAQLNAFMRFTTTHATTTNALHKIVFDLEHERISAEKALGGKSITGDDAYEPLMSSYSAARVAIPHELVFQSILVNGADELAGAPTKKVWFFCVPHGLCQPVVITGRDTYRDEDFVVTLNPYSGQFSWDMGGRS